MNRLLIAGLALAAAALVGCIPEAVKTASVDTMNMVFVYQDDMVSIYSVADEQHELLKNEFEAWKTAGFEDFDESFLLRPPTLRVSGKTAEGVAYKIDLHEDITIVREVTSELADETRYAREPTAADNRLRLFLNTCIATGALPRIASGKVPKFD